MKKVLIYNNKYKLWNLQQLVLQAQNANSSIKRKKANLQVSFLRMVNHPSSKEFEKPQIISLVS